MYIKRERERCHSDKQVNRMKKGTGRNKSLCIKYCCSLKGKKEERWTSPCCREFDLQFGPDKSYEDRATSSLFKYVG